MGKIGIIDYGMGNLFSVKNAFEYLGLEISICEIPEDLEKCERLVLPGVGAFQDCMRNLKRKGFTTVLHQEVIVQQKPILGICLGMQVMAQKGFEGGEFQGLGWFDSEVVRIEAEDKFIRIPHVGWNNLIIKKDSEILSGISSESDFYFVHSFAMKCNRQEDCIAQCDYGSGVTAVIQKRNIVATQFHPEKSQEFGLRILESFSQWNPVAC